MATAPLLRVLISDFQSLSGHTVELTSIGGVDALRRVMEGEPFDLVILASDAIDRLVQGNRVLPGSRLEFVRSSVAAAVTAGAPRPDISDENGLRAAVLAASRIGYSTGPSGTELVALLQRWGIEEQVRARMVQAKPGVPVGRLLASGEVTLGFQQFSELQGLPGIELLGELPAGCAIDTVFSGAICSVSHQSAAAGELLSYLNSPEVAPIKRRLGLRPP